MPREFGSRVRYLKMALTDFPGFDYVADKAHLLKGIVAAVAIGVTVHQGVKYFRRRLYQKRRAAYKKDVVILHELGRGKLSPSISPYCIKLETYLRLANIPYESDYRDYLGPVGKRPWITYNGHDEHDSRLCIEYLNREFKVNLNSHLSAEEVAVGHLISMAVEHHTRWIVILKHWVYEDHRYTDRLMYFGVPTWIVYWYISRKIKCLATLTGIGLLPQETVYRLAKEDFRHLSTFLGQKKFLFGDRVCEYDCIVFSWLSLCAWNAHELQLEAWINDEFPNLKAYTIRIKELAWPDWDSCLDK